MIDLFGLGDAQDVVVDYSRFGLLFNPFRVTNYQASNNVPFYKAHMEQQLHSINSWAQQVIEGDGSTLSIVGNIGVGKSHLMNHMAGGLRRNRKKLRILVETALLSDSGYARASIGSILIDIFGSIEPPGFDPPESDLPIMPLVWACANGEMVDAENSRLNNVLVKAQRAKSRQEKATLCSIITKWLNRAPLSKAEQNQSQLFGKIDWEGELVREVLRLLRFAEASTVIRTAFLFIDQLEELFRPNYSELRRSRLLTDLRILVDEIDSGAPLGLCLAWAPEFKSMGAVVSNVEKSLTEQYPALFTRLIRKKIDIPFLKRSDCEDFAMEWVRPAQGEGQANRNRFDRFVNDRLPFLVDTVIKRLEAQKAIYPGVRLIPRDFLGALTSELDRMILES